MLIKAVMVAISIFSSQLAFSHGGKSHTTEELSVDVKKESVSTTKQLGEINELYEKTVKPIFKVKCLDCHGSGNKKPWYYRVPGVRQLMDSDIDEAREHLDMSNGFPFSGHGSPQKDLEEIKEVISENSMPPWQYVAIHWESYLSTGERKMVLEWVEQSLKKISSE